MLSPWGVFRSETRHTAPRHFSVFKEGASIYLCDRNHGVYESIDNGRSWQRVFTAPGDWKHSHAIRVNRDQVWLYALRDDTKECSLRVTMSPNSLTWRDADVPPGTDLMTSRLAYDHIRALIFLAANNGTHVFSPEGSYLNQLDTGNVGEVYRLAIDSEAGIMYMSC